MPWTYLSRDARVYSRVVNGLEQAGVKVASKAVQRLPVYFRLGERAYMVDEVGDNVRAFSVKCGKKSRLVESVDGSNRYRRLVRLLGMSR